MNKPLYTLSYTLATAGAAGLLFAGIYALVDLYGYRRLTVAMEWMGMHALMIYVLIACNILPIFIHGFYWKEPKNNLVSSYRLLYLRFDRVSVNATETLNFEPDSVGIYLTSLALMVLCCS